MTLLRRYGLWLVLATVAGIVGAWLFYASRPGAYLSTAEVEVEPSTSALTTPAVPNMATEQQVATSGVVLAGTEHATGVQQTSLEKDLSAKVTGTTSTGGVANVLTIGCTMPTATAAQHCAAAATTTYMAFRNETGAFRPSIPKPKAKPKPQPSINPLHVTLVTAATLPTVTSGPGKRILLPIGAFLGLALGIGAIFLRVARYDARGAGRSAA